MKGPRIRLLPALLCAGLVLQGCSALPMAGDDAEIDPRASLDLPEGFEAFDGDGGTSSAAVDWHAYFADPHLQALVETALDNNQELAILLEEIEIARARARARSGEYLPLVDIRAGSGVDKVGEYTREGAVEEGLDLREDEHFPEPLPDHRLGVDVSWEVDIWNRLRNSTRAAALRYLATREGRNFAVTRLVAEIAESYYELVALDNRAANLERMLTLQQNALAAVRLQKAAAETTELAVLRFEAEVAMNRAELFDVRREIAVTENRLNYLAGRYPQPVARNPDALDAPALGRIDAGTPEQLLANRPDVRRAELELAATQLDVKAARARFYPRLDVEANLGLESADLSDLVDTPASLLYGLAGGLVLPVLNRREIEAEYASANAEQRLALERYRQVVLNAYVEVSNQLARIKNLEGSLENKRQQVQALSDSVDIAAQLFSSARADYMEVLLTQRDALESRIELVELRQQQLTTLVRMYQALGGGDPRDVES